MHAVLLSVSAGCAALKQRLWQLRLRAGTACRPGDAIVEDGGTTVGRVTSVCVLGGEAFALGYIKTKVAGVAQDWEGRQVAVGDTVGKVRACQRCRAVAACSLAVRTRGAGG